MDLNVFPMKIVYRNGNMIFNLYSQRLDVCFVSYISFQYIYAYTEFSVRLYSDFTLYIYDNNFLTNFTFLP